MGAIAASLGSHVTNASDVSFNTTTLPDIGIEPAVIGTAVSLKTSVISNPVRGKNGVYLVKVTSAKDAGDTNLIAEKQRLVQNFAYRNSQQPFEIQKKAVKIEDRRTKFF